jgi:hypothetical protein
MKIVIQILRFVVNILRVFPVKETCAREFEGQVTGQLELRALKYWIKYPSFLPLTKSFKVLD